MRSTASSLSKMPDDSDDNQKNTSLAETKDEIQLSDDVAALVAAITASNASNVIACIRKGVDVNTLIPDDAGTKLKSGSASDGNSQHELTTPLGLAISQLDYKIARILLENGANPNMTGINRSMIEMVMIGIANIACAQGLDQPLKRNLKLTRDISLPIKVKTTVTSSVIQNAQELLDLLLCYGLKPDAVWTKLFEESNQQLTEAVGYHDRASARRKRMPQEFDRAMEAAPGGIKKTIVSKIGHAAIWYFNRKKEKPINYLEDYLQSVTQVRQRAAETSIEIHNEKIVLLRKYQAEILTNIQKLVTSTWPSVLTDLVIEYINISDGIAKHRLRMNRIIKFWQIAPAHKEENELEQVSANQESVASALSIPSEAVHDNNDSTQRTDLSEDKSPAPAHSNGNSEPMSPLQRNSLINPTNKLGKVPADQSHESLSQPVDNNVSPQSADLSEGKSSPTPINGNSKPISSLRRNSLIRQADDVKADAITGKPAPLPKDRKDNCLIM